MAGPRESSASAARCRSDGRPAAGGPMALRMDGRALAETVRARVQARVESGLRAGAAGPPGLLIIRAGEDPASVSYVRGKERAAAETGIDARVEVFPDSVPEAELLARVA